MLTEHALCSYGGVAQLGERLPCTQEVIGSNPFTSTNILRRIVVRRNLAERKTFQRFPEQHIHSKIFAM
jgi:hypothetical protein